MFSWSNWFKPKPTIERRVNCGVAVMILDRDFKMLMGKRKGSHGAGTWAFPGGWVRHGETLDETLRREALEETGLIVEPNLAKIASVGNTRFEEEDLQSVTILMRVFPGRWTGTPVVKEPGKLDGEWQWFETGRPPIPLFGSLQELDFNSLTLAYRGWLPHESIQ